MRLTARLSRDTILFVTGLAGIVYETVGSGTEKPTLIIAFAAMLGLPLFIRKDEAAKDDAAPPRPSAPPGEVDP